MAVYLGFDASTQSLTALAIEVDGRTRRVVCEHALVYDEALPAYGTRHGVLPSSDPLVAVSSPVMWAEALDVMMARLAADARLDLGQVRAISGSGQQHGSVYLNAGALPAIAALDPAAALAPQLAHAFSRPVAPIWMDSSTSRQCAEIAASLGGPDAVARLTGSRPTERFTGPQVRKFSQAEPGAYAGTARVHLVSSFLATLLAGQEAPVDPGDGAGTNLIDLAALTWSAAAVAATAPGLRGKLPPLSTPWTIVGGLAPYWQARYGFPAARVVAWSGDNPCSLVGTGLVREGQVAVSLGTSDTVFGPMREPRVDVAGTGHVFGAPTGGYMGLTCFSNGSLARERVRRRHGLDWDGFSDLLRRTPAGNGGRLLLPWFGPEISPLVQDPGPRAYGLSLDDPAAAVRGVVEGQMLALARHSAWMGVNVDLVHATGGAAINRDILQVLADVFGARVVRFEVGNSACLGAALRAYHADERAAGRDVPWGEIVAGFVEPLDTGVVTPLQAHVERYAALREVHAACEAHALRAGPDPTAAIDAWRQRFGGQP